MIQYNKIFDDDSVPRFVIHLRSDPARGQVHFCYNLILNLFEKGNNPPKQELLKLKDKYQKDIKIHKTQNQFSQTMFFLSFIAVILF